MLKTLILPKRQDEMHQMTLRKQERVRLQRIEAKAGMMSRGNGVARMTDPNIRFMVQVRKKSALVKTAKFRQKRPETRQMIRVMQRKILTSEG